MSAALAHRFARPELLAEALTHRSAIQGGRRSARRIGSNERLEFLGDRVLNLVIAEWLLERHPDEQEGDLGQRHALLVSRDVAARVAEGIGLPGMLSVAPGEARMGVGRAGTVVADAMEAVIGAVFLDGGLEAARAFVRDAWASEMAELTSPPKDPKTALQEWLLARAQPLPDYVLAARTGPSHNPEFTVTVTALGQTGTGIARSKQLAQRAAAADLLEKLGR